MPAKFIELVMTDNRRSFVRLASIDEVLTPPGLAWDEIASPEHPLNIGLRDGTRILTFGVSAMTVLFAMSPHNEDGAFVERREAQD